MKNTYDEILPCAVVWSLIRKIVCIKVCFFKLFPSEVKSTQIYDFNPLVIFNMQLKSIRRGKVGIWTRKYLHFYCLIK